MTIHISLDIETWGKKPGCDIRSIGAVVFDRVTGEVGDDNDPAQSFYIATGNPLQPEWDGVGTYRRYNLTRDPETVAWWNSQGEDAKAAFENPTPLKTALRCFSLWYAGVTGGEEPDTVQLWTKGPHFDIAILQAAYDAVGLQAPWHYRSPRDMRTTMSDAGMTRDQECNYGVAHHALHDAIAQALTICEAWDKMRQPERVVSALRNKDYSKYRNTIGQLRVELHNTELLSDRQADEIDALKRLRDDLRDTTNRYLDRARKAEDRLQEVLAAIENRLPIDHSLRSFL